MADIYDIIYQKIANVIPEEKPFAIYPFGRNGILAKGILNWHFGIKEELIVDNYSRRLPEIRKIEEVTDPSKYIWLVTSAIIDDQKDIIASLQKVPREQVVIFFDVSGVIKREHPLSMLGEQGVNNVVCNEFLQLVEECKKGKDKLVVAEIGVDIGATTLAVSKKLDKEDTYYLFDFDEVVRYLVSDLKEQDDISCTIIGIGNSHKTYDSYSWNLSELVFEMRKNKQKGLFDIVYLDGAHNLIHDGLACCILKELIKPEGYIIFDDVNWSYAKSDTCNPDVNPQIAKDFTQQQINECQVQKVIELFMAHDNAFKKVSSINSGRAIYKKVKVFV